MKALKRTYIQLKVIEDFESSQSINKECQKMQGKPKSFTIIYESFQNKNEYM